MTNLTGVRAIASGSGHTLALLSDGTVFGWGANRCGELVPGPRQVPLPVRITVVDHAVAVAIGGDCNACALLEDGSVDCWSNAGVDVLRPDGTFLPASVTSARVPLHL